MVQTSLFDNRHLAKALYVKAARRNMYHRGFGHDWIENYSRQLGEQIEVAGTPAELDAICAHISALGKSMPPIGWIGA